MKLYELTYLISPEVSEENIQSLQKKIESLIKEGEGSIIETNPPVKRTLAYPIQKKTGALVADLTFNLKPEKIKDFEKNLKSESQILRYLISKEKLARKIPKARAKPKKITKPKVKVELKEVEKKLEEILGE